MIRPRLLTATNLSRNVARNQAFPSSPIPHYGRTAAYRRLLSLSHSKKPSSSPISPSSLQQPIYLLRSRVHANPILSQFALKNQTLSRAFHNAPPRFQQPQPTEEIRDPPRDAPESPKSAEAGGKSAEAEGKSAEAEGKSSTEGETKSDEETTGSESKSKSKDKDKGNKQDEPPPPPHGDKTPWQVFRETMKSEFQASKEWNDSTKQLASSAHQFTESEGVRKARAAYEATAGAASSKTAHALKSTASALGSGAAWTWDSKVVQGVRGGVNAAGRGIEKATRPVRETKAFQNIKEVVDDGSSSRYGGWVEKEERRKRKEARDLKEAQSGRRPLEKMEEDPNAGTNVTLHKDAAWKESWSSFKDKSKLMQSLFAMRNTYEESENPLISTARSITDRFAGFFAENETAMVIKKFREMDPNFQMEPFLRDMREYILPEVLDAYVKGDVATLKLWLSAAQFQVYSALMQQYSTAGLKSDGRILDIRHVDVLNARILEPGDIPVFIITCRTQEVHVYRNSKTNELAAGMEDRVQLVTYAIGVTRIPEEVNNPETRGWRMIEMQKAGRDYI